MPSNPDETTESVSQSPAKTLIDTLNNSLNAAQAEAENEGVRPVKQEDVDKLNNLLINAFIDGTINFATNTAPRDILRILASENHYSTNQKARLFKRYVAARIRSARELRELSEVSNVPLSPEQAKTRARLIEENQPLRHRHTLHHRPVARAAHLARAFIYGAPYQSVEQKAYLHNIAYQNPRFLVLDVTQQVHRLIRDAGQHKLFTTVYNEVVDWMAQHPGFSPENKNFNPYGTFFDTLNRIKTEPSTHELKLWNV